MPGSFGHLQQEDGDDCSSGGDPEDVDMHPQSNKSQAGYCGLRNPPLDRDDEFDGYGEEEADKGNQNTLHTSLKEFVTFNLIEKWDRQGQHNQGRHEYADSPDKRTRQ